MPGFGALPKDPAQRARRNKDTRPTTSLRFERGVQPDLPDDVDWPPAVHRWWKVWGESSFAEHLMQPDWEFLLDSALLKKRLWEQFSVAAAQELRLREDAFGVTLAARLKLRVQFVEADAAEEKRSTAAPSSRERRGPLVSVPTGSTA